MSSDISATTHKIKLFYEWLIFPSGAMMLFVGWQEGLPAYKKTVWCWHGYLSGAWCRLAYGPADATATFHHLCKLADTDI